jgi:LCP family protein required for cell wall assembly
VLFTIKIIDLDILPTGYLYILIAVIAVINILVCISLITKKKVFNCIGFILSILIIIASAFGMFHTEKISGILEKAFDNIEYETITYSVVVLKKSEYTNLESLKDKTIGYISVDNNKDKCIELLSSNVELQFKEYENSYTMYEQLTKKKIDAMMINNVYLDFLEDQDEDIFSKIDIIYTFELKDEIKVDHKTTKNDLSPVNILITGSDARSTTKIYNKTRSDVNMIMTINPSNHEILLTSIPRDYYVQLHGKTGLKDKLTHSGIYGVNMTKQTIEDFMNIKIDYVVKVGFGTVINVVDMIGGIDIEADQDVYTRCSDGGAVRTQIKKGWNHLTGAQALSYARERKGYKNGDNHRVQNQQQVIEAIFTKVISDKSLLNNYENVLNSLSSLYVTDIPASFIKNIVKNQISDMKSWKISKQQLTGTGKTGVETYSMPGWKLWVMEPNQSSINKNSKNINDMINGKTLNELNLK